MGAKKKKKTLATTTARYIHCASIYRFFIYIVVAVSFHYAVLTQKIEIHQPQQQQRKLNDVLIKNETITLLCLVYNRFKQRTMQWKCHKQFIFIN